MLELEDIGGEGETEAVRGVHACGREECGVGRVCTGLIPRIE